MLLNPSLGFNLIVHVDDWSRIDCSSWTQHQEQLYFRAIQNKSVQMHLSFVVSDDMHYISHFQHFLDRNVSFIYSFSFYSFIHTFLLGNRVTIVIANTINDNHQEVGFNSSRETCFILHFIMFKQGNFEYMCTFTKNKTHLIHKRTIFAALTDVLRFWLNKTSFERWDSIKHLATVFLLFKVLKVFTLFLH